MLARLPQQVAAFLDAHHVMTLATQGPAGPWAAAVFYAHDDRGLVFLSSPQTRHSINLEPDPRCAATIQDDLDDWPRIQGIQMEGRVIVLHGAECRRARQRYGERFPIVGRAPAAGPVAVALARVQWFRLIPERLYFIDNSRGFGHRDEFELARDPDPAPERPEE